MTFYTQNDSKVVFWPRRLGSKFLVFTRALCLHNGRSLQTQKLAPPPCQKPTFEFICVYHKFPKMLMFLGKLSIERKHDHFY